LPPCLSSFILRNPLPDLRITAEASGKVGKQFKKIATSPELGQLLGNKNGYDLSGCRKMYVDSKRIRIVYKIIDDRIVIEIIAIGKRDELEVYKKASQRL